MDKWFEFPEFINFPLAEWIDNVMDWVTTNWAAGFDAISDAILWMLLRIEDFIVFDVEGFSITLLIVVLLALLVAWRLLRNFWTGLLVAVGVAFIGSLFTSFSLPWFAVIVMTGLLAWRVIHRRWVGVIMALLLVLIGSFGYWDLAMETLAIIIVAVIISIASGIPIGIIMARSDRIERVLKPILDAMQTMPSFVYLVPAMMLFGLGKVPAVFATIIYAAPPVIRLTNAGIRQVSQSVIEASRALGSTSRQTLFEVQLPLAIPSITVGINQTTMMALAMVVIASMVGAGGIGEEVLRSLQNVDIGRGFEAGLSIVLLAIVIDRITSAFASRQQVKGG
jgi:glycine betaine/proline transport system permease protein